MPKYRPYSWTMTSAATLETPKIECRLSSIDMSSVMPCSYGCPGSISYRVSSSTSGSVFGRSPYTLLVEQWMNGASERVLAGVLQHVERADGVHVEVGVRLLGGPVVARLTGGVDHDGDVRAVLLEDLGQPFAVADVDVEVGVRVAELAGQPQQAPRGRSVLAEEVAAHVVVDADDVEAQAGEMADRLGADQSRRAGDQCDRHDAVPFAD